ncbi:MAG: type IV pilus secretin PilQ family protein [Porticoccaceae bacterium]
MRSMSRSAAGHPVTPGKSGWLWVWVMVLGLASPVVMAAPPATLDDIVFTSLPGGGFEARLNFSGDVDSPTGYVIESPPRMVFDFPNAKSALAQKKYALSFDIAKSAVVVTSGDRTRLILNLRETAGYDVKSEGHSVAIRVGDGKGNTAARDQYVSTENGSKGPVGAGSTITALDFQRGDSGEGLITVGLGRKDTGIDVSQVGKNIVVVFSHTSLPETLNRKLDVVDFATPVKSVDTTTDGSATKMVIEAVGEYDYLAYQADNNYVVSVKPLTREQEDDRRKAFQYTGEKLSLNFQNIEVRALLQLIADFSDFNLVASDAVNGSITLRLKNVPWDQALDIILKAKGLDKRVDGNVLMVAPAAEIAERERLQVEANKQLQELAPLRTEYIRIRYADAKKLFDLFDIDHQGGGGNNGNQNATGSILSARGNAIVDERTNTIILTDTEDKIAEFRRIVQQIDIPVRQVEIESRIVVANTDFRKQLGARWGVAALRKSGSSQLEITGQRTGLDSQPGNPIDFFGPTGGTLDMNETLAVDLGVAEPTGSIALGLMRNNTFLDLELSALQNDGYGEIISQPKVITSDKKKATIKSGTEVPYQQASSAGNTNVSFKDAVLKLEVTPLITPDNRIVMSLTVAQDSIGKFVPSGSGGQVPTIDTTSVETEALVGDGQTLVLGGIFKMESLDSVEKVPVLGDIPGVGRLFRHTSKDQKKQEILIFITPKILVDALLDQ